ncbi:EF-hand domain-containing protein [Rhodoplanes azumiensis]|uniref:EF-hand domain-containing protein n=1 Tax=Rhodoplanes azumiensis TaxID=1897628 RepID=A0ABW5AIQ1_9BRAD
MSSARITSAGMADTETLLNLLSRKGAVRGELQRPPGSTEHGQGFLPAIGAAVDVNGPGGAGKYSLSSETMAFLLTVQQTASDGTGRVRTGARGSEAGAGADGRIDQVFRAMDTDGDGRIGRAEFVSFIEARGGSTSFAERMFTKIDTTAQGFITRDGMAAALRQSAETAEATLGADGRRPPFSASA